MVSCLMGDSTALASAIVRCCPNKMAGTAAPGGRKIDAVFYLYESCEDGFIMTNFYYGSDTIFIGMGEVQYKGFMGKDSFTFTDVAGATSLAQSVGELTMAALQFAITDLDGVLSGFDSNLDFKNAWFA